MLRKMVNWPKVSHMTGYKKSLSEVMQGRGSTICKLSNNFRIMCFNIKLLILKICRHLQCIISKDLENLGESKDSYWLSVISGCSDGAALITGMIHSWKSFHGLRNTSTNSSTKCQLKLYRAKKKPHVNRIHDLLKAMNEKQMGMECVTRMDFLLLFTLLSRCLSQRVTPVQRELKDTLEYPAYL